MSISHRSQPIADVRLVPPRRDQAALIQAQELAKAVCAQLANLEATTNLDELMSGDRGRSWLLVGLIKNTDEQD